MTSNNMPEDESLKVAVPQPAKAVDDQLIEELVGRAQAEGLQLTGEGGLLQQLTKRLLESALEGEVTGMSRHGTPVRTRSPRSSRRSGKAAHCPRRPNRPPHRPGSST